LLTGGRQHGRGNLKALGNLRAVATASLPTTHHPSEGGPEFEVDLRSSGIASDREDLDPALEVKMVDPLSNSDWDDLVNRHPGSHFFHSAAWAKVLCKTYQHKPVYLHFFRRSELIALVPLMEIRSAFTGCRGVCLPFSDFCGPLVFDSSESGAVINKISDLARQQNWKRFELRGGRESLPPDAVSAVQFYGHKLSLASSVEQLLARFGSATRRAIRKAEKSGITVDVVGTEVGLREFYRLHVATRRRHGIPPQPISFFLNIHEQIIKMGHGFVALARSGSRVVAAAVFFQHGSTALYKFGASDNVFQAFRGNNLVIWEAIKFLMGRGCKILHFGRASLDNDGLRRFKAGWGATEEMLEYFRFDTRTRSWETAHDCSSGFHTKVFRRLPLALNRLAGAAIYRHLD
jgi:CelD/BcsL family acetyltransferase involved in cellulose biosynthesis